MNDGVLIVDSVMLSVAGQIGILDNGKVVLKNGATLHFDQLFVGQYSVWLFGNSSFVAMDATIDANGVMHFAELHDSCTYIARRTYFPDWTYRKIYNRSTMILEDIGHVGDMMVSDSCDIHLIRCDTLMPWLVFGDGATADILFPDPDSVDHFEMSESIPGVDGIGYTFVVDSCARCWWSIGTFPGCSLIVRDSEIRGSCQRLPGEDTISVFGIANYNYWSNLTIPLPDRHQQYLDTYVYWWNWYPWEGTVFYMDSCVFGEMITSDSAEAHATRSIHDGATIMLGTRDNSFMSFSDGASLAYISSFEQSTLFLSDVGVTPFWPYQAINIAHHHSNMLCVNCVFDSLPFALDTALVMFASIDSLDTISTGEISPIIGSAWLDAGPFSSVTFDRYSLYWASTDTGAWTLIADSTDSIYYGVLGEWNTFGLFEGEYTIRLTVWNSDGDSLTAFRDVVLADLGIENEPVLPKEYNMTIRPNPFNSYCLIETTPGANIEIYDVAGKSVKKLGRSCSNPQSAIHNPHHVIWSGRDSSGKTLPSGVYLIKDMSSCRTIKAVLLR